MKIGICPWISYKDVPLDETFRLIKAAGFAATCLWWGDIDGVLDKRKQPKLARGIGLEIDNIHAPSANASSVWQEGFDGDVYRDMLISCVNDCAAYQIPSAVIHLTSMPPYPPVSDIGLRRIVKIIEAAEQKNVKLAFENLWSPDHLAAVFNHFSSPNVGLCYDSGHENVNRPYDALGLYGDRLFAVHINDNFADPIKPDGTPNWDCDAHVLPRDGTIDWVDKMRRLKECKRIEYFTLEVDFNRKHEGAAIYNDLSAEAYLARAYERAVKLLELV
ncbi:MAG: sugar phosphate isomerase/epimerase [Defluviitaleaceae bacterium]|nr:sugar phosphate isomerase/epimerase [Defluviitaleaceae bacterium]